MVQKYNTLLLHTHCLDLSVRNTFYFDLIQISELLIHDSMENKRVSQGKSREMKTTVKIL